MRRNKSTRKRLQPIEILLRTTEYHCGWALTNMTSCEPWESDSRRICCERRSDGVRQSATRLSVQAAASIRFNATRCKQTTRVP